MNYIYPVTALTLYAAKLAYCFTYSRVKHVSVESACKAAAKELMGDYIIILGMMSIALGYSRTGQGVAVWSLMLLAIIFSHSFMICGVNVHKKAIFTVDIIALLWVMAPGYYGVLAWLVLVFVIRGGRVAAPVGANAESTPRALLLRMLSRYEYRG